MEIKSHIKLKVIVVMALIFAIVVPPLCESATDRLSSLVRSMVENNEPDGKKGTIWAVLVAGSNEYENYRHQADVCHAYQVLKKGGLKDENIIVFMYDDIAHNEENPRKGIIINHPHGSDVYHGVPKDYTGEEVNTTNFFGVILGNHSAVKGGSGKVVKSTKRDTIFIYYTDHGAPGLLGMPTGPDLMADDFIKVLKQKHHARAYEKMIIYVEACESGSIFEGLLPDDMNIYAMTASNAEEFSYAWYCPGEDPQPPPEYTTCLGDLYSIAWLEDSDSHNRKKETIKQQFKKVKNRTSNNGTYAPGSHVMEYGAKDFTHHKLSTFQGFDHATKQVLNNHVVPAIGGVNQRDAELLYLFEKYKRVGNNNSEMKDKVLKEMARKLKHRVHVDSSVAAIGDYLFGTNDSRSVLKSIRRPGLPLVDDWECLKSMVKIFEQHCGSLEVYGKKYMRAFANICNNGISIAAMDNASKVACNGHS